MDSGMNRGPDTWTGASDKQIILIVDGDINRQFLTSLTLQRLGYAAFPVNRAEEGLMILEMTLPILVITDIILPGMSGIELLKTLKQDADTRAIPVLIYSSVKEPTYRAVCEQAGSAGYLYQPADHNQLYEAVQKATASPRRFVRLDTCLSVIVEGAALREGAEGREQVTALSEHGMYVRTGRPLPSGTVVPFTLFLDRSLAWGIRVEGKVLYRHDQDDGATAPGMGIKFTQIRPEDQALIRNFIGKKLLEGVAVPVKSIHREP